MAASKSVTVYCRRN